MSSIPTHAVGHTNEESVSTFGAMAQRPRSIVLTRGMHSACYIWDEVGACLPMFALLFLGIDKIVVLEQELAFDLRQKHRILGRFVGRRRPGSKEVLISNCSRNIKAQAY